MNRSEQLETVLFGDVQEGVEEVYPRDGSIPLGLSGTYYLNGPANFQRSDLTYSHWLDGDGLIRALHFRNGRAKHVVRFVRTKKYLEEEAEQRSIYRAFGTAFPGDRLRRRMTLESPANVSVWPFAGSLMAFGEQALPWSLKLDSLETVGECNFGGKLLEISPFSAHPKFDKVSGNLCNFGLKYLMGGTKLCYWEFDNSFECLRNWEVDPELPYSIHDFLISENYACFYLSPYLLKISAFVRHGKSIFSSLKWRPELENRLLVKKRDGSGREVSVSLGARGYCLHLVNAFEEKGQLVVDLIETEEPLYPQYSPLPKLFASVKPGSFVRIRIDVPSFELLDISEKPQSIHLDFPVQIDSDPIGMQNSIWALGMPCEPMDSAKFYDRVVRFEWNQGKISDVFQAPRDWLLTGEPSLAQGVAGGESNLICPAWNAPVNESQYLVLNAWDLAAGPVAVLPVSSPFPPGFHSTFAPA